MRIKGCITRVKWRNHVAARVTFFCVILELWRLGWRGFEHPSAPGPATPVPWLQQSCSANERHHGVRDPDRRDRTNGRGNVEQCEKPWRKVGYSPKRTGKVLHLQFSVGQTSMCCKGHYFCKLYISHFLTLFI